MSNVLALQVMDFETDVDAPSWSTISNYCHSTLA